MHYLCSVTTKPFFQRCGRRTAHFLAARFFIIITPRRADPTICAAFFMRPKIFSKKWEKYLEGKNIFTTFALPKSNKQQQQQQSKPYASRLSAIL